MFARRETRQALIWITLTITVLLLAAALLTVSGLYSVAASRGHFPWTSWLLKVGMHRSVATHSLLVGSPPRLSDDNLVRLGAGHFHGGCVPCHGGPGKRSNPIVYHMLPPPPELSRVVQDWSDKELFWIVRNGIKYTGMPAWVALKRDDEVWAVVAFLRALPKLGAQDYRKLTRSQDRVGNRRAEERARVGSGSQAISACARCHGSETSPPISSLVPIIAGQPAAYLESALRQYADGDRESGIMQPVAAELDADAISLLSKYYAGLSPALAGETIATPEQITRGQAIATLGVPETGIPACLACHAGSSPTFPLLAGQHARYTVNQLLVWQQGLRATSAPGAIMAPIAKRLSRQQIDDVAAFFESLGAPRTAGDATTRVGQRP
ncbi:MAG: c-type cytochrome [Pseudorhodoplanes sp.]|uniref:c-type cytochrome n=1 Tax=Pseudorhodoplanes sp. TaxID=1934341 RepID=UPI003D0BC361